MDLFDSTLNLEEQHIEEGYETGIREGEAAGLQEGRELGIFKGFEIGHEVGFYWGAVKVWRLAQREKPSAFSQRVDRGLSVMEELLLQFPNDPQDVRLQDAMADLRGKFKAVMTMLSVKDAYFPDSQPEGGPMAF